MRPTPVRGGTRPGERPGADGPGRRRWRAAVLAVAVFGAGARPPGAGAQPSAFRYEPGRAPPVGTVWHFVETSRDGSRARRVDVRVVSTARIEAIRWTPGGDVEEDVAEMDWWRAMPAHLERRRTGEGETAVRLEAHLAPDGRTLSVRLAGGRTVDVPVEFAPLHLAGLDWLGLHFALPHLADPRGAFEIELAEVDGAVPSAPPAVRVGRARLEYLGEERCRGADCRKYRVRGPFFGSGEGSLWTSTVEGWIEKIEPPADGRAGGRLELRGTDVRDAFAWQRFKDELVADSAPWRVPLAERLRRVYAEAGLGGLFEAYAVAKGGEAQARERELLTAGRTLQAAGRAADAARVFELATREFPDSAPAWEARGDAEAAAGRGKDAAGSYRRALALDPGWRSLVGKVAPPAGP